MKKFLSLILLCITLSSYSQYSAFNHGTKSNKEFYKDLKDTSISQLGIVVETTGHSGGIRKGDLDNGDISNYIVITEDPFFYIYVLRPSDSQVIRFTVSEEEFLSIHKSDTVIIKTSNQHLQFDNEYWDTDKSYYLHYRSILSE